MVDKSILGIFGVAILLDEFFGMFFELIISTNPIGYSIQPSNGEFDLIPLGVAIVLIIIGFTNKIKIK